MYSKLASLLIVSTASKTIIRKFHTHSAHFEQSQTDPRRERGKIKKEIVREKESAYARNTADT